MIHVYYQFYEDCPVKEQYKTEHTIGLSLLSTGLKALYQIDLSADALPGALSSGIHGKPELKDYPDIHFNISHCKNLVLCCFDTHPVGIDAELIGDFFPSILKKTLSDSEKGLFAGCDPADPVFQRRFYCIWTLKESWIKQSGMGLFQELKDSDFIIHESPDGFDVSSTLPGLYFKNINFSDDYTLTICAAHKIDRLEFHHTT